MLKNKQIALEKKLGEIHAQEVQNRFDIYRNIADSEIKRLNQKILLDSKMYANFQMDFQRFRRFKNAYENNTKTCIPPNTVQAVKYAMKQAHPDNGGNAEDFMKFKKCYEELMRKGINK
ncbi:MAG: hypothetical protein HFG89_00065 [Dorea sp.]|nr:hypothetical protein [Dorea sp.]